MSRFLSQRFSSLAPYVPGEQPKMQNLIKLNTNENPYPPSPRVIEAITCEEIARLRLYSDPDAAPLTAAIAQRFGLSPAQVFVGNGSDEVLGLAFLAFGGEEKAFKFPALSYGFYPVFAKLFGVRFTAVPLREDFTLDPSNYMDNTAGVVIANPNAPTGLALPLGEIERICRANPDQVVIVDEAYADFHTESAISLLATCENLLVVQTFSKSRSLAGMRIGFALGSTELIADLQRMKFSFNPYNLDRIAILAGTAAMQDEAYFTRCVGKVIATRERTLEALRAMGMTVLPSCTNFLFARPNALPGKEVFTALRARGILVRRWDDPLICDWLRISIGTDDEMDALLAALKDILGGS